MSPELRGQHRLSLVLRLHAGPRTPDELLADLPFPADALRAELDELARQGVIRAADGAYELTPDADRALLRAADPFAEGAALRAADIVADAATDRVAWLRRIGLFAPLGEASLAGLADAARSVRIPAREHLFREGEPCEGIYVVESGVVKLLKQVGEGADAREQVIRLVAANDFFNEVPVFDGGPNPVSAEAMEESVVLVIPAGSVRALMASDPEFVRLVIADLAGRVRHLIAMVQDLSLRQVSGRVAKILLQSVEQLEGVGVGAERHPRMTQRDIAEMAGTVREVVARTLRDMERRGAIEMDAGRVVSVDRAKLLDLL